MSDGASTDVTSIQPSLRDIYEMLLPNKYRVSRNKFFWRFSKLKSLRRVKNKGKVVKLITVYKTLADGVAIRIMVCKNENEEIGIYVTRRGKHKLVTPMDFSVSDGETGKSYIFSRFGGFEWEENKHEWQGKTDILSAHVPDEKIEVLISVSFPELKSIKPGWSSGEEKKKKRALEKKDSNDGGTKNKRLKKATGEAEPVRPPKVDVEDLEAIPIVSLQPTKSIIPDEEGAEEKVSERVDVVDQTLAKAVAHFVGRDDFSENKIRAIFDDIDLDNNGFLDEWEFVDGMKDGLGEVVTRDHLRLMFDSVDEYSSGYVGFDKFMQWLIPLAEIGGELEDQVKDSGDGTPKVSG